MFGFSTSHLIILGFITLLFGSKRLPELGESMGNAIRAFKTATEGGPPRQVAHTEPEQKKISPLEKEEGKETAV